jgi:pseudaminic acid synthase
MKIGDFDLSKKCMIVAELSANHNGDINIAIDTIKAAKESGADAIKLQTYTPDTMTLNCDKDDFIVKGTAWDGEKLHDLYKRAYTPWEWHEKLFQVADEQGLICFSTPFDRTSIEFLKQFDPPAYKIASFEITDVNFIKEVAKLRKPVIFSTGIAEKIDIDRAISAIKSEGNDNIIVMKCTSSYPAPVDQANLSMIPILANDYNILSGLSDHTMSLTCPIVAVSLGACMIEKHFILDRNLGGTRLELFFESKRV